MLEDDDGVRIQIRLVYQFYLWIVRLNKDPAHVRVEQSLLGRVGIAVCVCVAVMQTMADDPPLDGSLEAHRAHDRQHESQWGPGSERAMGPQPVVANCDSKCGQLPIDIAQEIWSPSRRSVENGGEREQVYRAEQNRIGPPYRRALRGLLRRARSRLRSRARRHDARYCSDAHL